MINNEKLDEAMRELGHNEANIGTEYIRIGVPMYDRGCRAMTKELYPAIAEAVGSSPQRVERAIRHSIDRAWNRGNTDFQYKMFGFSVNPETGKPTVGQYMATMARLCRTSADAEGLPGAD